MCEKARSSTPSRIAPLKPSNHLLDHSIELSRSEDDRHAVVFEDTQNTLPELTYRPRGDSLSAGVADRGRNVLGVNPVVRVRVLPRRVDVGD